MPLVCTVHGEGWAHHSRSSLKDLDVTITALLVAHGCNVGYTPVLGGADALKYGRLSHVDQTYLRLETYFSELRGLSGSGGDLAEGGQAEVDHGGSAGDFGVELGELVFGGGEADAEPVDFAEPAFAFGFCDPRDEVDPDLVEAGPLVRVNPEHRASDAGVLVDALAAE